MINLIRVNLNFSGNYPASRAGNSVQASFGKELSGDVVDIKGQEVSEPLQNFKNALAGLQKCHCSAINNDNLNTFVEKEMPVHLKKLSGKDQIGAVNTVFEAANKEDKVGVNKICNTMAKNLKFVDSDNRKKAIGIIAGYIKADTSKSEEVKEGIAACQGLTESIIKYYPNDKEIGFIISDKMDELKGKQ